MREEDILRQFARVPDPVRHVKVIRQFADAGFDLLVTQNAGPDPVGFDDFYRRELAQPLRQVTA